MMNQSPLHEGQVVLVERGKFFCEPGLVTSDRGSMMFVEFRTVRGKVEKVLFYKGDSYDFSGKYRVRIA
jgi:hypothetical protein